VCRRFLHTNSFQRRRWMKWSNCNTWELKFKNLERISNLNLTQSGNRQSQSLSSSAKPLLYMLTTSPTFNMILKRRKLCKWLRSRDKHAMTMKMGCICLWFTLSDLSTNYKANNTRYHKLKIKLMLLFPKYLRSIRQDKVFQKKMIKNIKSSCRIYNWKNSNSPLRLKF